MSYKNFGCVKTIVLPSPDNLLTIDEYKKLYGIDLRDFIVLDEASGSIAIKNEILNSSLILIKQSSSIGATAPLVPCVRISQSSQYGAQTDAITTLYTIFDEKEKGYYGISLSISNQKEFSVDNVFVTTHEI